MNKKESREREKRREYKKYNEVIIYRNGDARYWKDIRRRKKIGFK